MTGNRDEIFEFLAKEDAEKIWEIKEYKEPRTKLANRYYFHLCGLIARKIRSTKTEVHNYLLSEYGEVDNDLPALALKNNIEWTKVADLHLVPTGEVMWSNDEMYAKYFQSLDSHKMNGAQFGRLIDGAIEHAKLCGVSEAEILTPTQKAELIALMEQANGKRNN